MYVMIFSNIWNLACQGLPQRRNGITEDDGTSYNYKLEAATSTIEWLKQKAYTLHEMQNEIIKVLAVSIVSNVASYLENSTFLT